MSLEQAFKSAVARVTDERGKPAILGKSDGTLYWVDPNGTTHRTRVWARIGEQNSNQAVVVDCLNASPQIDLPVRVDYKNGVLTVIGVDDRRAVEFGGGRPPGTGGAHAWLHSRLGPDPIYIEGLQYLPLGVVPSSPPDLTVMVHGGAYYDLAGDLQVFDTAVSGSTSAYVPGSGSHFVIICLDRSDGSIVIVDGDDVTGGGDALFPEASVTADEIEAVTIDPDYWPLGVVLLAAGQTEIRAKDIVRDLRPVASSGGGGTPGGSSGQVQYNDGGAFGGDAGFTWNSSTDLLSVVGGFALSNTSTADPVTASMSSEIDTQFFTFARQSFFAKNDAGEDVEYVRFDYNITDETDGDEGASFIIYRRINGTLAAVLSMSETTNEIAGNTYITGNLYAGLSGNLASITDTGIVFNSGEDDVDFRIAGNDVTNGYFYNAGNNRHGFGTGAPLSTVHIAGDTTIEAATQNYLITGRTDRLVFAAQTTGNNAGMEFFTHDGDGTDNIAITIYGAGLYTDITNRERMFFNYSPATAFQIYSEAAGTGTLRPIRIGMSTIPTQLELQTNGNVSFGATAAVILPRITTTQRNALTAVNGMIIYNTTTGVIEGYESGAWVNL